MIEKKNKILHGFYWTKLNIEKKLMFEITIIEKEDLFWDRMYIIKRTKCLKF